MSWKDFFYFSKGERRALTLLLTLIVIAFILLLLKDTYIQPRSETNPVQIITDSMKKDSEIVTAQPKTMPVEKSEKQASQPAKQAAKKHSIKPRLTKSAPTFTQKFPQGTIVELNTADTTVLKKVPGIGSAFANRIVKFRNLLGGYYTVEQLREVYGIDAEKYAQLSAWFIADTARIQKTAINHLSFESLARHPYISYKQARVIVRMRERKGVISGWETLSLLEEFTEEDIAKLNPYVSFD